MKVAAIIPALNEEKTIGAVIQAAKGSSNISDIIVVDDGSTDKTFFVAQQFEASKVIKLDKNYGKAEAMERGVRNTDASLLIFIDADFIGLTSQQLDDLIEPVMDGGVDMAIGKIDRRNKKQEVPAIFKHQAHLSGTRVLRRSFWEEIPQEYKKRYYIESAISYIAKERGMRIKETFLENVKHIMKEEKYGVPIGFFSRMRMFVQLAIVFIVLHLKNQ